MLRALILICNVGSLPECDEMHAVYKKEAPGYFSNNSECQQGGLAYLHTLNFDGVLESNHDYQITISCRSPRL